MNDDITGEDFSLSLAIVQGGIGTRKILSPRNRVKHVKSSGQSRKVEARDQVFLNMKPCWER